MEISYKITDAFYGAEISIYVTSYYLIILGLILCLGFM